MAGISVPHTHESEIPRFMHRERSREQRLMDAVKSGDLVQVQSLHEHGADIRVDDDRPVCEAAAEGHVHVLKYLHEHGANIRNNDDRPMHHALNNDELEAVQYLHEEGGVPLDILRENQQALYEGWRQWSRRHGRCPEGLASFSPFLFRARAFDDVVAMLFQEKEHDSRGSRWWRSMVHGYAYNTAGLLSTTDRVQQYLKRWGGTGEQPLHDVIQDIKLPQQGRFDNKAWGDAILRHGPKMARLVKFAADIPVPEKDNKGQWSYIRTREAIAIRGYTRGAENPALAVLASQYDWDNHAYECALATITAYEEKYAAHNLKKPGNLIPDVVIDGVVFDKPGHRFYRLPDGDMRGLLLGEFTGCCQHLAGAGALCAVQGHLSEQSGFYVVEAEETGEIVAQSWAWRGRNDELVLDSLESLRMQPQQWRRLCDEFARCAVADETAHVSAVHIGVGGATPMGLGYKKVAKPAQPRDLQAYGDAYEQYKVPLTLP